MTRIRVIGTWSAAVVVCLALVLAFDVPMAMSTATWLIALSMVPAAMALLRWPGAQLRPAAGTHRPPSSMARTAGGSSGA